MLVEEPLPELGDGGGGGVVVGRAADAGVDDEEVDVARLRGDGVDGGLQGGFGAYVALHGDDKVRMSFGCGFEDGEASA